MPALEDLDIGEEPLFEDESEAEDAYSGPSPHLNPPPNFAPKLKYLKMKDISFLWTTPAVFSSLLEIRLSLVFDVSLTGLLAVLVASPSLKDFQLGNMSFKDDELPHMQDTIILLKDLETIDLFGIHGNLLPILIKAIHPPRCHSLTLDLFRNESHFQLVESPTWVIETLRRTILDSAFSHGSFQLYSNRVSFLAGRVHLASEGPFEEEAARWITKFFLSIPPTWVLSIEVMISSDIFPRLELLQHLQCPIDLCISMEERHQEFLKWFGQDKLGNVDGHNLQPIRTLKIWLSGDGTDYFLERLAARCQNLPPVSIVQDLWIGLLHPREDVSDRAKEILGHQNVRCVQAKDDECDLFWYDAADVEGVLAALAGDDQTGDQGAEGSAFDDGNDES